jgi:hypothetical protein
MAEYEKTNSATVRHTETHLKASAPTKSGGGSSRLGMAKELTKKSVPVNMANGPANAKVYTFTRGEKPAGKKASSLKQVKLNYSCIHIAV